jgi:hypothetical protein
LMGRSSRNTWNRRACQKQVASGQPEHLFLLRHSKS